MSARIISPRVWLIGAPVMLAMLFYRPSPVLVIIAIMAFPQSLKAWKYDPKAPENLVYYGVPLQTKLEYGGLYLALTAYLAVMTFGVMKCSAGSDARREAVAGLMAIQHWRSRCHVALMIHPKYLDREPNWCRLAALAGVVQW